MILALEPDEVHTWYRLSEPTDGSLPQSGEHMLSIEECARRDRFRVNADRHDYAVAHDLLRRTLSRYDATPPSAWRFEAGADGKPFLADGGLSFNLSHTRGLAACGIARAMPVGVDVERTDRSIDIDALADGYFPASEAAALRQGDPEARTRFFDFWTLKEAFVKATGRGLAQPLDSFSFDLPLDEGGIVFTAPTGFASADWHFALYAPVPSARLAIAAAAPPGAGVRWQTCQVHDGGVTPPIQPIRTSRRTR